MASVEVVVNPTDTMHPACLATFTRLSEGKLGKCFQLSTLLPGLDEESVVVVKLVDRVTPDELEFSATCWGLSLGKFTMTQKGKNIIVRESP